MGIMMTILAVLLLGLSVVMVFLVLSQDVKGGGLAGALSGGSIQTAFGGRSAESVAKLTGWLAIAFFVLILMMNIFKEDSGGGGLRDVPGGNNGTQTTPAENPGQTPVEPLVTPPAGTPGPAPTEAPLTPDN